MPNLIQSARTVAETADRTALAKEEEAVEVASQWAQERLENFLAQLLKISYIISCRTSVDVFTGKSSDIGKFAEDLIQKLCSGDIVKGLRSLAGTLLNKLFGSASGSAQSEKIHEVTFDELGGLNRLDAHFFCYRFASSGITNFSKAVIGTCIVHSAAEMVDDNAYRVVLTSSATLAEPQRTAIADRMITVAKNQKSAIGEHGKAHSADPELLEARAMLAKVIGDGVATSEQSTQKRAAAKAGFASKNADKSAGRAADELAARVKTFETIDEKDAARKQQQIQD
ncbi:hypothetical protein B0T22DRAFT_439455 [Podospora appendiculata]|uniref:Uncharacterized protein n=1 Tax=Podospora appendiculata TaxID=314037 RepID=A0AAE1CBS4_9PEZI|nr:hypothetical protein B0T22DRAFT_439455 [Podospora appendiculata]